MKSIIYLLGTALILLILTSRVFCQTLSDVYRGHSTNDFYYVNTSLFHLYYITDDGKDIELKNSQAFWHNQYVTERTPEKLYSLYDEGIAESSDYGKTFNMLTPAWANADTGILNISGGEIPGLFYIAARCYSTQSLIYFKTDDSFEHIEPVNYFPLEVGHVPGEFYSGYLGGPDYYLTHTINNGISYDTMYIADTIFNGNFLLYKLSRGAVSGELFMVTFQPYYVNWQYRLYHSIDYGATWTRKNTPDNLNDVKFTAARDSCKFYIVDRWWNGEPDYTLNIYVSTDCGESYTKYTYMLPTYVGIAESKKAISNLAFSPNPAKDFVSIGYKQDKPGKITLRFYSNDGKLVDNFTTEKQNQGEQSLNYQCGKLKPGIYSIVIQNAGGETQTGKFVVTK